jgi:hypothetical protein
MIENARKSGIYAPKWRKTLFFLHYYGADDSYKIILLTRPSIYDSEFIVKKDLTRPSIYDSEFIHKIILDNGFRIWAWV